VTMEVHIKDVVATVHGYSDRKLEEITNAVMTALDAKHRREAQANKDRRVTSGPRDVQEGEA